MIVDSVAEPNIVSSEEEEEGGDNRPRAGDRIVRAGGEEVVDLLDMMPRRIRSKRN